jgi:uncharacterized protein YoxC
MEIWNGISFALIRIILPIAGIASLVFLSILFYELIKTARKANDTIDDVNDKISVVNPIFDGIANFEASYSGLGSFVNGIALSAARARATKTKQESKTKKKREK